MDIRFLSPASAITLLNLAKEVQCGKRQLPPEISAKKREVREAYRHTLLFSHLFNVIDRGMVERVTRLRIELDTLYGLWAESETPSNLVSV